MDKNKKYSFLISPTIIFSLLLCVLCSQHVLFSMNPPKNLSDVIRSFESTGGLWKDYINRYYPNTDKNNLVDFKAPLQSCYNQHYYKDANIQFPRIILSKQEIIDLGYQKTKFLNTIQFDIRSRKKLVLLKELPQHVRENLKPYFYCAVNGGGGDEDYRLQFFYTQKLSLKNVVKATLKSCKLLPYLLARLVYYHLFMADREKLWVLGQDSTLLEENKKNELTNALINTLQEQSIPGSDRLLKLPIQEVPFKWMFPTHLEEDHNRYRFYEKCLLTAFFNGQLLYSWHFPFPSSKYFKTSYTLNEEFYQNIALFLFYNAYHLLPDSEPGFYSLISKSFSNGLVNIVALIGAISIIRIIVNTFIKKPKIIDFPKDKFKNKSVDEVLDYYLNNPNITIL